MAINQTPPEKKVERVVKGDVIVRKKSSLAKIRDMFIAEDADKVGNYILADVLVPSIKRAIVDIIKSSADMIFGTKGSQQNNNGGTRYIYGGSASYVSYGSSQQSKQNKEPSRYDQFSKWDFSYVEFSKLDSAEDNKKDADTVVRTMCDIIEAYKRASVADLCELLGGIPYDYTAHDYGWTNLTSVVPIRIPGSNGYYLRFPKVSPIDKD